ncbi:polymer-forming cytoskeletal protein [Anaerovoracaceae bacterium 41-7]|uniref:Polymer-forming cytoskeletal protein n=1 Tax=Anaerotruncus colihominis TaxID=169435 RepID=A0A845QIN9_9FIRM|nr:MULTISPECIES: polymer-forming cytoskeletal protein [Eubacteriales]MCI9639159.1 polymer-forming cytoskeletal protein [Emergencia sp.]NBH60557.1 polymer-forming cytoskeletal protein [Anaerotruncus colihominis]NCF01211.1 polymer-forming cytoskeletal protein [Anaerotruncus sp. 80]
MEEEKKQQTEYEEPVQEETAEEEKNHEGVLPIDETGVIAANTKVTGDIVTRGHLMIYGEVEGNVTAAGNITATGRISGDIACSNLKLTGCQLKSNLTVKENILMDADSKVEGRIFCSVLSADGTIKGNIEATSEVQIHSSASITGGIRTKSISVDAGAQLLGSMQVVR